MQECTVHTNVRQYVDENLGRETIETVETRTFCNCRQTEPEEEWKENIVEVAVGYRRKTVKDKEKRQKLK